jgi:hypothetical protein
MHVCVFMHVWDSISISGQALQDFAVENSLGMVCVCVCMYLCIYV